VIADPCVYILASRPTSRPKGALYIGATVDLARRVWEHREQVIDSFTSRYDIRMLVFAEFHRELAYALTRERQIKKWHRQWKINLIERSNPEWRDLYDDLLK